MAFRLAVWLVEVLIAGSTIERPIENLRGAANPESRSPELPEARPLEHTARTTTSNGA